MSDCLDLDAIRARADQLAREGRELRRRVANWQVAACALLAETKYVTTKDDGDYDQEFARLIGTLEVADLAIDLNGGLIRPTLSEWADSSHDPWIAFDSINEEHPYCVACSCFAETEGLPPSVDLDAAKRQVRDHLTEHGLELRDVELHGWTRVRGSLEEYSERISAAELADA